MTSETAGGGPLGGAAVRNLRQFIKDSGRWGLASEAAALCSFVVGLYDHFHEKPLPSFIFMIATVVLFSSGAYAAWNKKKQELESEIAKNLTPAFTGEISAAFIGSVGYVDENGERHLSKHDSFVLLQVTAWNKRNMAPSSVGKFHVTLEVNGKTYQGKTRWAAPEAQSVLLKGVTSNAPLYRIEMGSGLGDLLYLSKRSGNLLFRFTDLAAAESLAQIRLVLTDLNGKDHSISALNEHLIPGRLEPCWM